jgi:hypothetical protein
LTQILLLENACLRRDPSVRKRPAIKTPSPGELAENRRRYLAGGRHIIAVSSARSVVAAKKSGHGPRHSFRLFQQQKVPSMR